MSHFVFWVPIPGLVEGGQGSEWVLSIIPMYRQTNFAGVWPICQHSVSRFTLKGCYIFCGVVGSWCPPSTDREHRSSDTIQMPPDVLGLPVFIVGVVLNQGRPEIRRLPFIRGGSQQQQQQWRIHLWSINPLVATKPEVRVCVLPLPLTPACMAPFCFIRAAAFLSGPRFRYHSYPSGVP